ncbi:hypothetical protein [Paractinoplanes lichenicola]|uniref:Lipoprotein n=1 Tax=Paractinoplanes lichenicola TaxID=2802976 RepID=A0ABS1VWY4_9ACTN|nr:hypothetical protein [Actinoplanes lichenicola]MBL7258954.1 hypothetical protein [Actinoplanes lichenicola]
MKRRFVAAAVLVLALAGCTSADGPAMTVEQAGATYLELSTASNAAREAWMRAPAPTTATLAQHKQLAEEAAEATATFSQGLRDNHWPDEAQPAISALDDALQEREAAYKRVATAGNVADYLAAASEVPVTTSLTGDVRKALGLPEGAVVTGATPR